MARVVVGIDGSSDSVEALLLADAEARWRHARLEAVHVYAPAPMLEDQPAVAVAAALMWPGTTPRRSSDAAAVVRAGRARQQQQAHDEAVCMLARCVAHAGLDGRLVDQTVVADSRPARALLRMASMADLLVLGGPGRGRLGRQPAGSVSRHCVRHADCPVLIVGRGRRVHHSRRDVLPAAALSRR